MSGSSSNTPLYPISTAARILGVSVHTLRMYERRGLIVPHHAKTNQRLYSDRDIERLQCVRNAINVDKISIEGMRRVLSLIPCWLIVHCPENQRGSCTAFTGRMEPCWLVKEKGEYCRTLDCRECRVYKDRADCHAIKLKLKELLLQIPSEPETVE